MAEEEQEPSSEEQKITFDQAKQELDEVLPIVKTGNGSD